MNNATRRGFRIVASTAMILLTGWFIARDIVWSGQWSIRSAPIGKKSATISAPWPTDHWQLDHQGVRLIDPSLYVTVRIPRRFDQVAVSVRSPAAIEEVFLAAEVAPNTLRYALTPMESRGGTHDLWESTLNLSTIDQSRGKLNFAIRIPQAGREHPVTVSDLMFTFYRKKQTLLSIVQSLWRKIM